MLPYSVSKTISAVVVLGLLPTSQLMADDEAAPLEELFRTEMVFPQEKGEWQFIASPSYEKGGSEVDKGFTVPLTMEYGLTDQLTMELNWEAYKYQRRIEEEDGEFEEETGNGLGNLSFELQYSWIDIARSGTHVAVGFEYELPTSDRKLVEDDEGRADEHEVYVTIAKDFDSWSENQVLLQVGMEREEDSDEVGFANLAGYMTIDRTVYSLELSLSEARDERFITPGVHFKPMEDVEIGLGVSFGIDEEASDYQLLTIFSLEYE